MPRRPRKQPRASNGTGGKMVPGVPRNPDGKMKRWVRREDVAGDEEDQFHYTRDQILLEGEGAEGEEWGDGEEEVYGLGLDDDSDGSDGEDNEEDKPDVLENDDEYDAPRNRKKAKKPTKKNDPPSSGSDSDESESWGRSKSAYYASNASLLSGKDGDEDEEEANEMEEREAQRLQARMRENLADDDFGLEDDMGAIAILEDAEPATVSNVVAVLPAPGVKLDRAAALRHLEKTSPETLALAREWDDVARDLVRTQQRLDHLQSTTPDALTLGLSHLHHQTLLTYVTTLAFYLHLRAAPPTATLHPRVSSPRVKPVLARLLTLKQALSTMEDLDFDASDSPGSDGDYSDASDLDDEGLAELGRLIGGESRALEMDMSGMAGRGRKKMGLDELEALLRDADAEDTPMLKKMIRMEKQSPGDQSYVGPVLGGIPKSNTLAVRFAKTKKASTAPPTPTFDLMEPAFVLTARTRPRAEDEDLEAYGEATSLSMVDDADKKARKRSLRFHTSKIETSARRREEGRVRLGGDDDIPYRERRKEKEARVRRELEMTRGEGGDDLEPNGGDADMGDSATFGAGKRKRNEDISDEEGDDGYYELVKRAKKEKKEGKRREYEETRMAERLDVTEEGVGGARSLTRAILKNKGLTPRRSKSVRNPRVKKRERFEKAKKKVRSQKAVYKGGLAGKPYGGEESGITKVVKSIKL